MERVQSMTQERLERVGAMQFPRVCSFVSPRACFVNIFSIEDS
jgi:hypothetical protein